MPFLVSENGSYFLCKSHFQYILYDFTFENIRRIYGNKQGKINILSNITKRRSRYRFLVNAPALFFILEICR